MSAPSSLLRSTPHNVPKILPPSVIPNRCRPAPNAVTRASRYLATVHSSQRALPDVWFTASAPLRSEAQSHGDGPSKKPPDERTVKLGKSKQHLHQSTNTQLTFSSALRILQERLPTLLQSPLPQEILSPQITLHLFPSTHPHLPTVSGRVAYSAALWTSPLAWGRVPLVGNVKLEVISERVAKSCSQTAHNRPEQLIVRWRTIGKTKGQGTGGFYKGIGARDNVDKITEWLGGGKGEDDRKEFTGLFIFEFDEEGRVASHTIEHAQVGGNWEKGVGARVMGLTDWLLGGMKNGNGTPCPAFFYEEQTQERSRR